MKIIIIRDKAKSGNFFQFIQENLQMAIIMLKNKIPFFICYILFLVKF